MANPNHKLNEGYQSNRLPILIIGSLFFIFGFITWLNATLIPYLKIACELTDFQSYLVTFSFYIAYFLMALPMAGILKKTGLKKGMSLGLVIMACGAGIFLFAAYLRAYELFLSGLFLIGTGLTLLQTAANPYVAVIGPLESAAKRMAIMGICNKIAGVIAPVIMGAIILKDADKIQTALQTMDSAMRKAQLDELSHKAIIPYLFMTVILLVLAIGLKYSSLPEIQNENESKNNFREIRETLSFPKLRMGIIALFLYVGAEVIAADTIGPFGQSENFSLNEARNFASFTLTFMVIGYVCGIFFIPKYLSQVKALSISAISGLFFTIAAISLKGYASVFFIALLGLSNALIWPAIWPLAIDGLGKYLKTGSALLIMAIAGGAILPLLYGFLSDYDYIGRKQAYWILAPCYLFIIFYARRIDNIQRNSFSSATR